MEQTTNNSGFEIKAYYRKELQEMYGVPFRTFYKWLKPFAVEWKLKHAKIFSPEQVEKIVKHYGIPTNTLKKPMQKDTD